MNIDLQLIISLAITIAIIFCMILALFVNIQNREKAKLFLDDFINTLHNTIVRTITEKPSILQKPLDEAMNEILDNIYDKCWNFIIITSMSAFENNEITRSIFSIINRDFVDSFVDELIERYKIKELIEEKWQAAHLNEKFVQRVEEEDKKLQEKYSDQSLYNEELDVDDELELVDAGVAYTTNDDGTIDEIERPEDVEDPNLDTEEDESVEMIDGLTEEEIAAGVHFNKAGRKIDKHGRFVK